MFLHMDSEDSDQTGRMPRLICLRWMHRSFCWFFHASAQIPLFMIANSVDPNEMPHSDLGLHCEPMSFLRETGMNGLCYNGLVNNTTVILSCIMKYFISYSLFSISKKYFLSFKLK